ncbi:nuclear transport factor 2 family protein [Gordonia sp. ABSL11-1]|uniref:nuclear transport factor 2 family protein n=1 Tax=Gordonia sp. ABSL11-1 TaxID=3053924 RepID=UPI002573FF89|nr:nuclear transport factor 2 family protein [Gordonia sp. ABSL11-1]MDL9945708.1 nuclear transport factor 2 family protein [Gordonia sp. ABSL11-1]
MLTIEEISARLEIQQILTEYSTAVDSQQFEDLDRVFTADARIDYSATGGIVGDLAEVKAWLAQVLPAFSAYCHLVGNHDIRVDGDAATTRSLCLNPMQTPDNSTFLLGLWYSDTWILTDDGWRITTRTLERCFDKLI